jgi:elongation factor G
VVEHNKETNETVIRGLSDLHLRVMLERMKDRYGWT